MTLCARVKILYVHKYMCNLQHYSNSQKKRKFRLLVCCPSNDWIINMFFCVCLLKKNYYFFSHSICDCLLLQTTKFHPEGNASVRTKALCVLYVFYNICRGDSGKKMKQMKKFSSSSSCTNFILYFFGVYVPNEHTLTHILSMVHCF
jgi:hypothetical protein